jgi:hypothetical protein
MNTFVKELGTAAKELLTDANFHHPTRSGAARENLVLGACTQALTHRADLSVDMNRKLLEAIAAGGSEYSSSVDYLAQKMSCSPEQVIRGLEWMMANLNYLPLILQIAAIGFFFRAFSHVVLGGRESIIRSRANRDSLMRDGSGI